MKPFVLGITGPAGSGKSVAVDLLRKEYRFGLIDVDALGHTARENRKAELVQAFGQCILAPDGTIDRKTLGQIVFLESSALQRLNSIVHPEMVKAARAMLSATPGKRVLIDAALLYSMGLDPLCSRVITITAPETVRLERLVKLRGYDENRARGLIETQRSIDFSKADVTIENTGGTAELETAVRAAVKLWIEEAGAN